MVSYSGCEVLPIRPHFLPFMATLLVSIRKICLCSTFGPICIQTLKFTRVVSDSRKRFGGIYANICIRFKGKRSSNAKFQIIDVSGSVKIFHDRFKSTSLYVIPRRTIHIIFTYRLRVSA